MNTSSATKFRMKFSAFLLLLTLWPLSSYAFDWPQEITSEDGIIVVYQPQPEKLEGNVLTGRAAMSLELNGNEDPIFGAFWFSSIIDTDTDAGTALVREFKVTKVSWADSTDATEQQFTAIVEAAMPQAGFETSLDVLSASLASADQERKSLDNLRNDPPAIVFSSELAVLLPYDGTPKFSPVENSDYERALNVPFVVVKNTKTRQYYLSSGQLWYQSSDALGPWLPTNSPPADLVAMLAAAEGDEGDEAAPQTPPKIVVATEPTELISTQGKANWDTLPGGDLLYVSNTETPWLRELSTQNMYILLSGRWYRSKSQNGPWTFVRPDELPASFQDIPPASDIGGLRVSVAGTDEAEQAMMDAQIPQTAAINRNEASLTTEYDGTPEFEDIEGTEVSYAVNTGAQVLEIDGAYYAVDNGVWFVAPTATGPWVVADEIPNEEISQIPPSSPVYNTTYVTVYRSTPEVVYVGYTPGYLWSFPYYGVPVYGTGYYYRPYWGHYYYPRPLTWGFHVGYNPWTGWNYGVSWSSGFFRYGVGWGGGWYGAYRPWRCCGGGWYGGGYHHRPVVSNTRNINIGNTINVGNRTTVKNNLARNNNFNLNKKGSDNIYNQPENRKRNANKTATTRDVQKAQPANKRANDVYADRNGNVAKRSEDGWQKRDQGTWKPAETTNRVNAPTATGSVQRPATSPATKPATKPAAKPETKPATAPATRPATTPATKPATAPTTRPATAPATKPATAPTTRPATKPPATPTTRPTSKPTTQPPRQLDESGLNRDYSARESGVSREKERPQNTKRPRKGG